MISPILNRLRRSALHRTLRLAALAAVATAATSGSAFAEQGLLNASYDVARELYASYNKVFEAHWKKETGEPVRVNQSHGSSSKQARSVIDGLAADVVTMNQSTDISTLADRDFVAKDWESKFPNRAVPYGSTILFLVRKGNPKGIKDWNDLVREGVQVIIPNPKTAGNGRYSYIAAWGYALKQDGGNEEKAREFVKKLFGNVPVLDAGGRGATVTFAKRGIGDVLLTFENEVKATLADKDGGQFEAVVPSVSIAAESPVAVVEPVVKKHGTEKLAKAYLDYLYSDEGQEVIAKHFYRPVNPEILKKHEAEFPPITLFTVDEVAGGWKTALKTHFADGGVFDQIYTKQ